MNNRDESYGGDIADIVIDDELEVGDIDECMVPGIEVMMRTRLQNLQI